jgi:hypothetical protein
MTAQLLLMHLGKNLILQGALRDKPVFVEYDKHVTQAITKIYITDEQV